jgi:hypothetical protein
MSVLTGVWTIESWSARSAAGETSLPFGEKPQGILVYTADGTMSACFMRAARQPLGIALQEITAARRYWLGMEAHATPPAPILGERFFEAAIRFNSYAGRYSIDGDTVHHDVEVALFPDWVGKRLSRRYRLQGERLALSFEAAGQADILEWRWLHRS